MLKKILDTFRKNENIEDYLAIKTSVVENFIIRDLEAQVAYERDMKEGLQKQIQKLEEELAEAIKEKEKYCDKYITADTNNFNQAIKNGKLQAKLNGLILKLRKFEGSPIEE